MTDEARLERMIEAFHKLNGSKETLPDRRYGHCGTCSARVEWIVTEKGKNMMLAPNSGEPHIPHCGKWKWTRKQWSKLLDQYIEKEKEINRIPFVTVPDGNTYKVLKGKEAEKVISEFGKDATGECPF